MKYDLKKKTNKFAKQILGTFSSTMFDLLNYCWELLREEIHFDDYPEIEAEDRLFEIFNRMYDFLDNSNKLRAIIHVNQMDGILIEIFFDIDDKEHIGFITPTYAKKMPS